MCAERIGRGRTGVVPVLALALALAVPTLPTAPAQANSPASVADACAGREGWSDPAPPAHIHGHSWYVGTCGITAVLVETGAGLVLIDSGPEDAALHVLANVRALGLDPRRIGWILSTHEHFDHAGGIADIQRATDARLATGPFAARALRTGRPFPDDPQYPELARHPMRPARVDRVLRDGGTVAVGDVRFTARSTPAHSPGSTSWTWRSCEAGTCLTIAYADSVSTISAGTYRFSDHPARIRAARAGLRRIAALPCDLLLTPHPSGSNLLARLSGKAALVDPQACRAYAMGGRARLDERLANEAGTP